MQRSVRACVRSRGFLSMFKKSEPATSAPTESATMSQEEREKLRGILPAIRTESGPRSQAVARAPSTNMDEIRARGVMTYRYNYTPPTDIIDIVKSEASSVLRDESQDFEDVLGYKFEKNNEVKAKVIIAIGSKLNHFPTNSRLLYLKSVADVLEFYEESVHNIDNYSKLARSEDIPANVHIMEHPARFHPEDTHAWHGGITAFPGEGGKVLGIRNKRLFRQFQPKENWFDYEDQSFDYTRPEKDMPWDPEIANKMDRHPDMRYSLQKKAFVRTK